MQGSLSWSEIRPSMQPRRIPSHPRSATATEWCRHCFSKSANVQLASFISKNRLNRQNDNRIQAAQNRPSSSQWLVVADVIFLSLLGRLSFVPWLICQHEKRHICLDMSTRFIRGFLSPVLFVEISRLHSILQINTGLFWLASRGGDDAYLENVG